MEKKDVIRTIIESGATQVNGLKVKSVTVTPCENYVRLALTLDKAVKGYVSEDNGVTYTEGETKVIFVSLFSIISLLKDNDDAAFAANHLLKHPESMNIVLSRATINILQQPVATGEEYRNPWSETAEATVFDHDTIINHIVDLQLSDFAVRKLDSLADNMMFG